MGKQVLHRFGDLTEFVSRAEQVPYESLWAGGEKVGGVESFSQAVGLARHGWNAIRPTVDSMVDSIVGDVRDTVVMSPRVLYDQVGIHPDMDAVFAGDPDYKYLETSKFQILKQSSSISVCYRIKLKISTW